MNAPHIGPDVTLDQPAFIHPTALIYGKVLIGRDASVFPYVVMRAEMHQIQIGARTNIQDHVMVHVGDFTPTIVGEDCSITHHATLHGCEIGDRCLIGINSTVMDGAVIGDNSIVAGHAIVNNNQRFGDNSIIAGVPAKKIGERDNSGKTLINSGVYQMFAKNYAAGIERMSKAQIKQLGEMVRASKG